MVFASKPSRKSPQVVELPGGFPAIITPVLAPEALRFGYQPGRQDF